MLRTRPMGRLFATTLAPAKTQMGSHSIASCPRYRQIAKLLPFSTAFPAMTRGNRRSFHHSVPLRRFNLLKGGRLQLGPDPNNPSEQFNVEEEDNDDDEDGQFDDDDEVEAVEMKPHYRASPEKDWISEQYIKPQLEEAFFEQATAKNKNQNQTTQKQSKNRFFDRKRCLVQGGNGGNGTISFLRDRFLPHGGPDGGDGGRGGNVNIVARTSLTSLESIKYHQFAKQGGTGAGRQCHGKRGDDITIEVPLGTIVRDIDTRQIMFDMNVPDKVEKLVSGGAGGRGNRFFSNSKRQTPYIRTLGKPGEKRAIEFELKLIADVGLVGYPNAGKSTFLGAVSKVKPVVAAYPFTTIHPMVGEIYLEDFSMFRLADTPGLVAGAHIDIGLGHDFLRHIERNKVLAYVIDVSGIEGMGIKRYIDQDGETKFLYEFDEADPDYSRFIQNNSPVPPTRNPEQLRIIEESEYNLQLKTDESFWDDYSMPLESAPSPSSSPSKSESTPLQQSPPINASQARAKSRRERKHMKYEFSSIREMIELSASQHKPTSLYMEHPKADPEDRERFKKETQFDKRFMYVLQPWEVLEKLRNELEHYIPGLSERCKLIIANKMDMPSASKNLDILRQKTQLPVFPVSAMNREGLREPLLYMNQLLQEIDANRSLDS